MKEKRAAMNRKNLKNLLRSGSALATLAALWIYRQPLIEFLKWFSDLDAVIASIKGYGLWGPAVLTMLFILQTFIAFIPGQALAIAGGYVYGFSTGMLIAWSSGVTGGQVAFWLARRYGRPIAEKWVSPRVLDRWDKSAAGQGIGFYVVTLLLPFFPNDAMCYVAGLGNISFRRFLAANVIGRGIASLLTVIVGAYAGKIPSLIWVFAAGFVALGIVGWFSARRYAKTQPT
jgi:uncharacterized membrane protein YdjX (TVP38/TMEM64 family)